MSPPSSTSRAKGDSGEMRDHIATLKKELADLMIAQRKVETEREGMEAQRDSLLNQLTDYGSRMAAVQESVNTIVAELKTHTRDRKTEESAIDGFTKERAELADEVERLKKIEEGAQSRRDTLAQELAGTQEKATQAREEMAQTQEEIAGIINILQVLTENISFTVEEIQGSIQYANKEALEDASQEFRKYVSDISEMLGTIEQVGLADLNDFISNVKLFIENADESVNYLMTRIQDNADNAVHSSADEFNGFMQDLVEIINNTRLTLKKLEISDLGGVYDIVSSIQADLDKQVATLMEAQAGLAAKETFL
ncbi:MAG TPA: hypothetical protein VKK79_18205, partial [Candidatus Lokiarchaeia archaeon]|nr:hypothetical protein [Candidatus Lokiarchaeia archaeon]